jgi:hypothetical protein
MRNVMWEKLESTDSELSAFNKFKNMEQDLNDTMDGLGMEDKVRFSLSLQHTL